MIRLELLSPEAPIPAWVCFLTSDGHLTETFDRHLSEHRKHYLETLREVPLVVRLLNWWSPIYLLRTRC